ncbi:MAG: biotin synthase BioB [Myxococcota bacterium]
MPPATASSTAAATCRTPRLYQLRGPAGGPMDVRHDWTLPEVRALHDLPLFELIDRARAVHREAWGEHKVQLCQLLSIKTGGCPEDCGYCPQAARYHTGVEAEPILSVATVLASAKAARDAGATRFCMGAAWRSPKDHQLDPVVEMIRGVRALGMEACCTLGMLTAEQAQRLADAGLSAYNHNLDTSPEHYGEVISTRTYADRLRTLEHVRAAGVSVCCGGILGLGESVEDRCRMLVVLATQAVHPESVPINALVAVPGTPLGDREPPSTVDMVRVIATARILMPQAMVRLSAGREAMSEEAQLLCLLAGANSVFFGDKLLTTPNPEHAQDMAMFERAGIRPLEPASLSTK